MIFGQIDTREAEGTILAHSVYCGNKRLKKGSSLTTDDIALLLAADIQNVSVARLEAMDIGENEAAAVLAAAIAPLDEPNALDHSVAFTGRVNLIASAAGVALIDSEKLIAMNTLDPMISCATVPNYQQMQKGGLVATIKIISYGVSRKVLQQACDLVKSSIVLKVPEIKDASLLITQTGSAPNEEKAIRAVQDRLEALGVVLSEVVVTTHDVQAMGEVLQGFESDLILILTGSATSDLGDTAPSAVRSAGGEVERFGMPVDPGNLLFLGQLQNRPVIGLPGCARSPALNGVDWVMSRVICGLRISASDFAQMSVGGLLKEIPTRPQPRRRQK